MVSKFTKGYLAEQLWIPRSEGIDIIWEERQYTFEPKFSNLKSVPTYLHRDGYFGFPRNARIEVERLIDEREEGMAASVRFLGKLRDIQLPVLERFDKQIAKGQTDLILEADTGSGKTVMMLNMWTRLSRAALVIVPKTDLVEQWRKRIMQFTDVPAHRIGLARQGVCEYKGKLIVVGMLHSLYKDMYPEEFKRHFGVVFFDELHKLGAFHFSKVGSMFPGKYRIGATATLERPDGLQDAFYAHLGRKVIRPNESDQPIPKVVVYQYPHTSGKIPHYLRENIQRRGSLLSLLAKNTHRTSIIAQLANQLIESGRQTLVVSDRIPHLEAIRKLLISYGNPADLIGLYLGRTKNPERERVAAECTCICATMNMLTLGTDIPTLRGLVFATPISDVAQPVGRIRRHSTDKEPFVVDFLDKGHDETVNWYRKRSQFYYSIGCNINIVTG